MKGGLFGKAATRFTAALKLGVGLIVCLPHGSDVVQEMTHRGFLYTT